MKFKSLLFSGFLALIPVVAHSFPATVQPGSLETSGCTPSTVTPCFKPYSTTNPVPVNVVSQAGTTACSPDVGPGTGGTCTQRVILDSSGATATVTGNAASGATDVGNPVKTGCIYNSTLPTVTTGQRIDAQCDSNGISLSRPAIASVADADGKSNTTNAPSGVSATGAIANPDYREKPFLFNGATWDRQYYCNASAVVAVTAGSTTQIVGLVAAKVIHVCSFTVSMATTGTAQWVYGTGSNCVTGTTNLTGAVNLIAGTPWSMNGSPEIFRNASANELCLVAVTGNVNGVVTYAQF